MALKGTLRDFSLADILQLIGIQRKTGVLTLRGAEDLVSISFVQGSVASADSARRCLEERVGDVLIRRGLLTPAGLEKARERQHQTLERLWTVLLEQGAVGGEDLREALRLQVDRLIYPIFRWKDGEYSFTQEAAVDFDRQQMSPIPAEAVLMEGVRMMDEWPVLEKRLRSLDAVFHPAPLGGRLVAVEEAGGATNPAAGPEALWVTREEYAVYDLVDGRRAVREILELSPVNDFQTSLHLCNLLNSGLITSRGSGEGEEGSGESRGLAASRPARRSLALHLVLVALLLFTLPRLHRNPLSFLLRSLSDGRLAARLSLDRDLARAHSLDEILEVYRLEKGRYPGEVADLARIGLVREDEIRDSRGRVFRLTGDGRAFSGRPPSADSEP